METVRDLTAGTVAGVAGIVATQPLDCIRVRLQTGGEAGGVRQPSALACARYIWRTQGARGFLRGMSAPVVANAPINATIFAVEGLVTRWFDDRRTRAAASVAAGVPSPLPAFMAHKWLCNILAGSVAGLAQVPFSVPAELVKLQMQVDRGASAPDARSPYATSWRCVSHIFRTYGLRGVYTGGGLTLARDTLAFGSYFATYELVKDVLVRRRGGAAHSAPTQAPPCTTPAPAQMHMLMLAGGAAGVSSWVITYPLDVLKSCVQGMPLDVPRAQRSAAALFRLNWQQEGVRFFFRGFVPTIARAFLCSAVVFPVYEVMLELLQSPAPQSHQDELHGGR